MTHSLHRRGCPASLKRDFVFIARSSVGVNRKGCGPKLQRIRQILHQAGPVNAGMMETGDNMARGNFTEKWLARTTDDSIIAAVFSDKQKLRQVLSQLRDEDLGISITISGLIDEVFSVAGDLGLKPHTVNLSLGVHGRTDLLPAEETLQATVMCGHALAASSLAEQLKVQVKAGELTAQEAARRLAEPCVCGIFNVERAASMLAE